VPEPEAIAATRRNSGLHSIGRDAVTWRRRSDHQGRSAERSLSGNAQSEFGQKWFEPIRSRRPPKQWPAG